MHLLRGDQWPNSQSGNVKLLGFLVRPSSRICSMRLVINVFRANPPAIPVLEAGDLDLVNVSLHPGTAVPFWAATRERRSFRAHFIPNGLCSKWSSRAESVVRERGLYIPSAERNFP